MRTVLRLFPGAWRERYGEEFLAMLEDQPPARRRWLDIARCLVAAHLDRRRTPSLEPAPPGGRALLVALGLLGGAIAVLGAVFVGGASYTALQRAADLLEPLVVILPVAVTTAVMRAYRRDADRSVRQALPPVAADAFLLAVLGLILVATLRPQLGFFEQPAWIELRLFHDLVTSTTEPGRAEALAIIAANLFLFMLFGFALAMRRGRPEFTAAIGLITVMAIALEASQALLGTGRPSDVTVVLVRIVGGSLGYLLWRLPASVTAIPGKAKP